jgi:hydroxymethylpyrimidine pyrophosphatase-like HAD family hydrolase
MSKIIFFDIDGTLYDSRIGIPESTVNALNRLIANEHKIVMCTGRSKGMIPEEYFHMGFDGVILGAGTYVEYEGKILHQELMTPEEVQTVIDWGKKQKIGIILEGEKYGYYDPENTDDYYIAMKNKTEADCKTTLYPLNEAVDVPKWTYHHMELSKKPEIEEILDHTGISREDSYAFGDSANDIDMIKYVKYGVAMGNSVPELLEIAPYQTARVDEDGIEKGLKKFGLI